MLRGSGDVSVDLMSLSTMAAFLRSITLAIHFSRSSHSSLVPQVNLACELEMPLFLHCRDAFPDLIAIIK